MAFFVSCRKKGLARCGKCRKAFYCNAKCQVGNRWKEDFKWMKLKHSGVSYARSRFILCFTALSILSTVLLILQSTLNSEFVFETRCNTTTVIWDQEQCDLCDVRDVQKGDWAMHKLECSAMTAFDENWCPSEIARLVARILTKKVGRSKRKSLFDDTLFSRFWCLLSATETTERKMCLWKDLAHGRDAVAWVIDYLKR